MQSFHASGLSPRGSFAPPVSDYVNCQYLLAGTAERHTVPTGAKYVVFNATADFWASFGDDSVTAAVPTDDITDGSSPLFSPASRRLLDGQTHISVISEIDCIVTMEFYGD